MLRPEGNIESLNLLRSQFELILRFYESSVNILEFDDFSFKFLILSLEISDDILEVDNFLIGLELKPLSDFYL